MSTKRVLVVGGNGLLGQRMTEFLIRGSAYHVAVASQSPKPVRQLTSASYMQMDITSKKDVKRVVYEAEPDVIINCAAMTNVDACENERERAWKINVEGVEHLIEASRRTNAKIYHVSTDYVFDGKSGPYDEQARPEPLSYYGKTKLASENALHISGVDHFIARAIVLYGTGINVKPNFALWLIQNLEQHLPVKIVDDQFGNPTFVDDLAQGILGAIELERLGTYHLAGRDIVSRHEFAIRLARIFDFDSHLIVPIKTSQLKQPAARPMKSGLVTLKAEVELGYRPSTVEQGLLVLRSQLARSPKKMPDSAPLPSTGRSARTKR
ncbi:MAG: dTDP-4-dehydrorhamnose reductase [Bacteroidetes bacterium]|nr:dTDP-4-dehydrorhamnose reductase [Bacteroidota bacterium]